MAVQYADVFCGALIVKCGTKKTVITRERRELPAKVSYKNQYIFLQPPGDFLFSGMTGVTQKILETPGKSGRVGSTPSAERSWRHGIW